MHARAPFTVRFWGVRGSIPTPGRRYLRYGGNTSCIEVRCGRHLLILDGGTGLRELGEHLTAQDAVIDADILLTHTHMDHINGLPFFSPLFDPRCQFRFWTGHLAPVRTLQDVLAAFMSDPVFPVPPSIFQANVEYMDFLAGASLELPCGVTVHTAPLNHPQRATGYRIEYDGRSVCYVTDTEHVPGRQDPVIVDFVRGADLFIYDSTYTDEEYPAHVNYGHSTWQEGVRIANAANVGTLVVFHHDPTHHDDIMDRIAADAEMARPGTHTAKEGDCLDVPTTPSQ